MTDLETQVRAALDQLAATVPHTEECSGNSGFAPCDCGRVERLLAAWSQATARAAHKLARAFAVENVTEFGFGVPEEIDRVTASNEYEFVAALREGEAP